jgi:fatty acid desaturase
MNKGGNLMITILTVLGLLLIAYLMVEIIIFLFATCWWLGIIVAIVFAGVWIDYAVIKHGLKKLFHKKSE